MNNEIKFTATQQKIMNNIDETSIQTFQESMGKAKMCDVIFSINKPSRFRKFINSVKSFFKRLLGIKDNKHILYINKNRNASGYANFTINYKQKTITKNN